MKYTLTIASICLALLVAPTDTLAKSKKSKKVIDCDATFEDQHHLQKAVDKAKKGAVVKVKGTCVDIALVIDSPRITVQGEGSALTTLEGNGVDPVITISGADGATIEGLELHSGTIGLSLESARAHANDVTVTNNITGFVTSAGGTLNCNGCSADGNTGFGAIIFTAMALCGNNSFSDNGRSGVLAHSGIIYANGDLCTDPLVLEFSDNGTPASDTGSGIQSFQNGSFFVTNAEIEANNNVQFGILDTASSSVYISNSSVTLLGNGSFIAVLTVGGSNTAINSDPPVQPVISDGITFTNDFGTFASNGDFPNNQIVCGPDGGGEISPGCP